MNKIAIIGAGIGGLTTAIALIKKGFEVEIFENTPVFKKAGSGINLAMNAMQVYKRLGVYDDIITQANYTNTMNATTKNLKVLASTKFKELEEHFGVKNVAIHRATLHQILINHLPNVTLNLNKKLVSLEQKENSATLHFGDGTQHESQILIGADGINSTVRKFIFPNAQLRDAKQVCWRGISRAKLDPKFKTELNEAWGQGNRFGFVHITNDLVYWYALTNKSSTYSANTDLISLFREYHEIIKTIIQETPHNDIIFNEIWDLKPINKWHKGNICLLGDAAHATTPNMGQGAVQAIESALALSMCLGDEKNIQSAFKKYENLRMQKAHYITNTSWKVGKLAQTSNPVLYYLRNLLTPLIPQSITKKQNKKIFNLNFLTHNKLK